MLECVFDFTLQLLLERFSMKARSIGRRITLGVLFLMVYAVAWYMTQVRTQYQLLNAASLQPMVVETVHGTVMVDDPLIIELIASPAFQRLKKIRQYGSNDYMMEHSREYTRFEHSLGVFYLLRVHGASRKEQIAGLLHDASHTVFSHATEPLLSRNVQEAYQDSIHEEFLRQYGIENILSKYGLEVEEVLPKNEWFTALEQPLPSLCADRIEYNLYAGLMDGFLTMKDLKELHEQLHFDGQHWYFDTAKAAKKIAHISLYESIFRWQSPEAMMANQWICDALHRAWDIGLIDADDIHFNITDDAMWDRLQQSDDALIHASLTKIVDYKDFFSYGTPQDYDIILKGKFRGVDPLVATQEGLQCLSCIDEEFKNEYERIRSMMERGWYIKLLQPPTGVSENFLITMTY